MFNSKILQVCPICIQAGDNTQHEILNDHLRIAHTSNLKIPQHIQFSLSNEFPIETVFHDPFVVPPRREVKQKQYLVGTDFFIQAMRDPEVVTWNYLVERDLHSDFQNPTKCAICHECRSASYYLYFFLVFLEKKKM